MNLIRSILKKVNTPLTSEEVLSFALQRIKDSFGFLACSILLLDPDRGRHKVVMSKGWSNAFIKEFHRRPFEGFLKEASNLKRPLLVISGDRKHQAEGYSFEHPFGSCLSVPMGIRGKDVGIPYWHEQLDREINRAEKADYDISLMEISLNRFKEYNSMYGHLKGDQLLTEIPSALTDSPGARFGWGLTYPFLTVRFPESNPTFRSLVQKQACRLYPGDETRRSCYFRLNTGRQHPKSHPPCQTNQKNLMTQGEVNLWT